MGKLIDKPVEQSGNYVLQPGTPVRITAEGLSFGYDEKPVINNVSFEIREGEKISIAGADSSGKSTLLKLLTGVYRDFNGSLMFNGIPLGNYDISSLRRQTGIFYLHENIFHGTLLENLTMGRAVDPDYLNDLIQQTGLNRFLQILPLGYDTELDPTGKRLPMNVIQKILFVRALSHKPRLLLLEEPWRGLEDAYKSKIRELLLSLPVTVIVATNDESFTAKTNKIIQL